jgi:hypothetical protein
MRINFLYPLLGASVQTIIVKADACNELCLMDPVCAQKGSYCKLDKNPRVCQHLYFTSVCKSEGCFTYQTRSDNQKTPVLCSDAERIVAQIREVADLAYGVSFKELTSAEFYRLRASTEGPTSTTTTEDSTTFTYTEEEWITTTPEEYTTTTSTEESTTTTTTEEPTTTTTTEEPTTTTTTEEPTTTERPEEPLTFSADGSTSPEETVTSSLPKALNDTTEEPSILIRSSEAPVTTSTEQPMTFTKNPAFAQILKEILAIRRGESDDWEDETWPTLLPDGLEAATVEPSSASTKEGRSSSEEITTSSEAPTTTVEPTTTIGYRGTEQRPPMFHPKHKSGPKRSRTTKRYHR